MSASETLRLDGKFSSAENLAGNVDEIWRRWVRCGFCLTAGKCRPTAGPRPQNKSACLPIAAFAVFRSWAMLPSNSNEKEVGSWRGFT
ncbi:MAG TPA: hypothetical protein VN065_04955 [Bradyrhizobium sp.]|jgi:hypothetical protein|nr:hypothetical protein [Bradyrhizobium sp.]